MSTVYSLTQRTYHCWLLITLATSQHSTFIGFHSRNLIYHQRVRRRKSSIVYFRIYDRMIDVTMHWSLSLCIRSMGEWAFALPGVDRSPSEVLNNENFS